MNIEMTLIQSGLLLPDQKLQDVIAQDAVELSRLNLAPEVLGDALDDTVIPPRELRDPIYRRDLPSEIAAMVPYGQLSGRNAWRRGPVAVMGHFIREVHECPWKDGGPSRVWSYVIYNMENGLFARVHGGTGHLIRRHGFFGGPGTDSRVDPAILAALLGLANTSHTPQHTDLDAINAALREVYY